MGGRHGEGGSSPGAAGSLLGPGKLSVEHLGTELSGPLPFESIQFLQHQESWPLTSGLSEGRPASYRVASMMQVCAPRSPSLLPEGSRGSKARPQVSCGAGGGVPLSAPPKDLGCTLNSGSSWVTLIGSHGPFVLRRPVSGCPVWDRHLLSHQPVVSRCADLQPAGAGRRGVPPGSRKVLHGLAGHTANETAGTGSSLPTKCSVQV